MTLKLAFAIVYSALVFSEYFISVACIPNKIKHKLNYPYHKRIKPIDCLTCLSVWCAVVFYFIPHEVVYFIGIIFTAGLIGNYIQEIRIRKYENIR